MNSEALQRQLGSEVHFSVPRLPIFQDARIKWVFTGRTGGFSTSPYDSLNLATHVGDDPQLVQNNRYWISQKIGLTLGKIVWMEQIHTTNIGVIVSPNKAKYSFGKYPSVYQEYTHGETLIAQTDALITLVPGIAVAVVVADCVPVILYDPTTQIAAAVHAGRPGIAAAIIPLTIQAMCSYGAEKADIRVVMGPCAQAHCYEIPEEMAQEFQSCVQESIDPQIIEQSGFCVLNHTSWGTRSIDLAATITLQLLSLGIMHITQPIACTICDTTYYSYRRESTTGRCAGIVWVE